MHFFVAGLEEVDPPNEVAVRPAIEVVSTPDLSSARPRRKLVAPHSSPSQSLNTQEPEQLVDIRPRGSYSTFVSNSIDGEDDTRLPICLIDAKMAVKLVPIHLYSESKLSLTATASEWTT